VNQFIEKYQSESKLTKEKLIPFKKFSVELIYKRCQATESAQRIQDSEWATE